MNYIVNKNRLVIVISLMMLEVLFLSLAIKSFGNKDEYYNSLKVMENNEEGIKLEENDSWPGTDYKLTEQSGCINKNGTRETNDLEYSEVSNKVVMKFDSSVDCYLYFEED